jgi:hypothetical protein
MDIGESFNRAWEDLFGFLPNLLGFLVLIALGYVVARLAAAATFKVLEKTALDRRLRESEANVYVEKVMSGARPSRGITRIVFWLVFAFFLFSAVGALKIPALTRFMNDVLSYLPNLIVAIVIFVGAAVVAGAVSAGTSRLMGETATGRIAGSVLPALVMVVGMFMILEQLGIAQEIVRIAFAATMFALALGLALAFGLGGRDLAGRMLEDAYRQGREDRDEARREIAARERAEQDMHRTPNGYSTATFGGEPEPADPSLAQDVAATRSWSSDSPQSRF